MGRKKHKEALKSHEIILMAAIAIMVVVPALLTFQISSEARKKLSVLREQARKPSVSLEVIDYSCGGCMNVEEILSGIRNAANISEIKNLGNVPEYVSRLPAIIVRGEIDKFRNITGLGRIEGDVLVIEDDTVPYYSVEDGAVVGQVDVEVEKCDGCFDPSQIIAYLNSSGIYIRSVREVPSLPSETAPAIAFSPEIERYNLSLEMKREGDMYIFEPRMPPYLNKSLGRVVGIVNITYLVDSTCADCYNVSLHDMILGQFGMRLEGRRTVDINTPEGREIAAKYRITAVPTIIISRDALLYPSFATVWGNVGTIEDDALVFRSTEFMQRAGGYRNITI